MAHMCNNLIIFLSLLGFRNMLNMATVYGPSHAKSSLKALVRVIPQEVWAQS